MRGALIHCGLTHCATWLGLLVDLEHALQHPHHPLKIKCHLKKITSIQPSPNNEIYKTIRVTMMATFSMKAVLAQAAAAPIAFKPVQILNAMPV